MGVSIFSPAKINLFLAITGRRADGFHDLVSVAAPLDFGDTLAVEAADEGPEAGRYALRCSDPTVPTDETNLVLKAARAYAAATGWKGGANFSLEKRIPPGAGLGGGSSNAVAALRALDRLAGGLLGDARMVELAAALGSDCAMFVKNEPVVMRGRGERIAALPAAACARLRGRRVLVFKPSFGISTPWAYGRMIARGTDYLPAAEAERRLGEWTASGAPAEDLLFNNMELAADEKFLALPVLREKLRREYGVAVRMSGSGSASFALLPDEAPSAAMTARIRECWGPGALVQEARIA